MAYARRDGSHGPRWRRRHGVAVERRTCAPPERIRPHRRSQGPYWTARCERKGRVVGACDARGGRAGGFALERRAATDASVVRLCARSRPTGTDVVPIASASSRELKSDNGELRRMDEEVTRHAVCRLGDVKCGSSVSASVPCGHAAPPSVTAHHAQGPRRLRPTVNPLRPPENASGPRWTADRTRPRPTFTATPTRGPPGKSLPGNDGEGKDERRSWRRYACFSQTHALDYLFAPER